MEKILTSLTDLETEAKALVAHLAPKTIGATLVTLSGELGAGKTAFTQAIARAYGVSESVTSPTFVLEKVYVLPKETGFVNLIHIDAYRLESAEELRLLGWEALMKETDNLVLLEWPEHVKEAIPEDAIAIRLEALPDGSRRMTYV